MWIDVSDRLPKISHSMDESHEYVFALDKKKRGAYGFFFGYTEEDGRWDRFVTRNEFAIPQYWTPMDLNRAFVNKELQVKKCAEKIRYPDKNKANANLSLLVETGRIDKGSRVYLCDVCRGYHLTRREGRYVG